MTTIDIVERLNYGRPIGEAVDGVDEEGEVRRIDVEPDDDVKSDNSSIEDQKDSRGKADVKADHLSDRERVLNRLPQSIETNRMRIIAYKIASQAMSERELTAQEEIGGLKTVEVPSKPLDEVILGAEPWQREVYDAVERFGMNELTLESFLKIENTHEGTAFSVNFNRFMNRLKHRERLLNLKDRDPNSVQSNELGRIYHKDPDSAEMKAYAKRIRDLLVALEGTGIPELVNTHLDRHPRKKAVSKNRGDYHNYQLTFK